jgi:hypothetical protein
LADGAEKQQQQLCMFSLRQQQQQCAAGMLIVPSSQGCLVWAWCWCFDSALQLCSPVLLCIQTAVLLLHCSAALFCCVQVVKGQVWTFEQTQAFFFDVFTPVRMTVIKLKSGGLWVHAPVAPTQVGTGTEIPSVRSGLHCSSVLANAQL